MRELRYLSSSVFFVVILFLLYITYQNIGPYVVYLVLLVVSTGVISFVLFMGSVNFAIWKAFTSSAMIEQAKAKVRIPRKKPE